VTSADTPASDEQNRGDVGRLSNGWQRASDARVLLCAKRSSAQLEPAPRVDTRATE
jgi:hypothetical protein